MHSHTLTGAADLRSTFFGSAQYALAGLKISGKSKWKTYIHTTYILHHTIAPSSLPAASYSSCSGSA